VLTEAGCTVKFDIEKCVVEYNEKIILTGMKDPTTDLWTLPIVGSAGKSSPMDNCDEQDAFETLRDEFMERNNAACSATTSSLAVPLCTSTQAYTTGETAKYTLPIERIQILPTHRPDQGQQHQVCTSIDVQSHDLDNP